MICKTQGCDELAQERSRHTQPQTILKKKKEYYKQTIRYYCSNGHWSYDEVETLKSEWDKPQQKDQDTGVKRFHRKGFTGHEVKSPYKVEPIYPALMSNHQRMRYRVMKREQNATSPTPLNAVGKH